jgi:hypothetical protein
MPSLSERFWAKVDKSGECWIWTGNTCGRYGEYGQISVSGKPQLTHRVAYELEVGDIPDGLTIDHVKDRGCTSKLCCRPEHLEAVTLRENLLRSNAVSGVNARKTHCPRNHPYDAMEGGKRVCRTCRNLARHVVQTAPKAAADA